MAAKTTNPPRSWLAHAQSWTTLAPVLAVLALVLTTVALVSRDGSALGVVWYGH
jgi:hypothetical protein